jgi:hypothetical protein
MNLLFGHEESLDNGVTVAGVAQVDLESVVLNFVSSSLMRW